MLSETQKTERAFLPISGFKDHLKLGGGFGDDALQESVLEAQLRAAIAVMEARLSKAIFRRNFIWKVTEWKTPSVQTLPIAPVTALISLKLISAVGAEDQLDLSGFALMPDPDRPRLVPLTGVFPEIQTSGQAHVAFTAGLAKSWADLPSDMAQAIMITASHFYEDRSGAEKMPKTAEALVEKYRSLRFGRAK